MKILSGVPNDVIVYIFKLIHNDLMLKLNKEYRSRVDEYHICDMIDCHCLSFRINDDVWLLYNYRLHPVFEGRKTILDKHDRNVCELPKRYIYSSCIDAKIY